QEEKHSKKNSKRKLSRKDSIYPLKKPKKNNLRFTFFMPTEIANLIMKFYGIEDKKDLFKERDSINFNQFFIKLQENRRPRIDNLLLHVIRGEQKAAEIIITQHPDYLLDPGHVIDFSGRQFYRTALQCALAARDVIFKDNIKECMAEMIIRHLRMQPNGDEVIAAQVNQQFPLSWNKDESIENLKDMAAVEEIFKKIYESTSAEQLTLPMEQFRNYLKRKYLRDENDNIIIRTTGYDFNYKMLQKAYQLHIKYENQRIGRQYYYHRNDIAWVQVIGYLQRFLPACEGQIYAQNLLDVMIYDHAFSRCLDTYGRNFPSFGVFFPLEENKGLGFNIAEPRGPGQNMGSIGGEHDAYSCYEKIILKKNSRMQEILGNVQSFENTNMCSIQ
ncbi:MAG TPA: hypothetical protein VHM20_06010, partial [Gammaproteobacteria bacterium]|nr:hypothetical protein [Gammaproteobacteria bacterium]